MGIAPLIAAVRRRPAHWRFGTPARSGVAAQTVDGGDGGPIGLTVELYMGGNGWVDISDHVYYRDKIKITRGRGDETSQVNPQTASVTLNNRGGTFTPRLPTGPYYGLIGRNTPIRISRLNNGIRRYRYHGEVPSWPTTSDITGRDVYEQIDASGMLRRLRQGNNPAGSAYRRAYTTNIPSTTVAYWPCEDGTHSATLASGLPGGLAMTFTGQPSLAQDSTFICSDPLPLLSGSSWTGAVQPYTQPSPSFAIGNVIRFLLSVPATGAFDTAVILRAFTTGTVGYFHVRYGSASGGSLQLTAYDQSGSALFTSGYVAFGINGTPVRVSMELDTSGSNILWKLSRTPITAGGPPDASGIWSSATVGQVTQILVNPDGNLNDTALGHISVQSNFTAPIQDIVPLTAWLGEPPDVSLGTNNIVATDTGRFSRLCTEQGVPAVVVTGSGAYAPVPDGAIAPGETVTMGYQVSDTFGNLLQGCADSGLGFLYEARDQLSLAMRSRLSMYNQAPHLTLDHSQHQLSGPLRPLDDDQQTRNDIQVTRVGGSSTLVQQTTGTLSIQDPPEGVGDYQTQYQLSLGADSLLADAAGWRLHMGTVDEPRYPQVMLNLRHPTFTGNVDLMNAALTLDIGDRILITNPPPELPPDPISLIVQGYSETLGIFEHDMVITCSPESPYRVGILDDPVLGRADTDGSTLAAALGAADTALSLATSSASSPTWTVNHQDTPFDVAIGGERITLAVAGTLLNQNPFFATDISGWSALGAGATVSWSTDYLAPGATGSLKMVPPGGVATVDAHDTLTGVGTVTAGQSYVVMGWVYSPNGWSDLRVCADWYDSSGVFVSSSLGSASSVAAGTWTFLTQTLTAAASASQAQLRVRQGSTPAATDVFYCWAVRMVPSASVSATSPQTFTGIRSVNGVVKSQAAGTDVRLWQPMILSL